MQNANLDGFTMPRVPQRLLCAAGAVVASAAGAAAGAAQAVISSESSVNKVIQREARQALAENNGTA